MDNQTIDFVPTVYPTMEEFQDFQAYVNKLDADSELRGHGAVKVVPPKGWRAVKDRIERKFDGLKVIGPIEQNFHSHQMKGFYELVLIQKKSMKLLDYKKRAEKFDQDHDNLTIEKIEEKFWRSLSFNPPIYGADVKGSLFDEKIPWNQNELHTILNDGLGATKIYGINDPYFYFGAWRTVFAWHTEDLNLPSINFLHYGKPKFWYTVGRHHGHILDEVAKKYFPESFAKCDEHMRHKTTMINPYVLRKLYPEIRLNKVIQREGEFVITFPGSYHSGFNFGFNIAEAVNFGVDKWINMFTKCGVCQCQAGNVNINPTEFYKNLVSKNPKQKVSSVTKNLRTYIKEILGENLENIHIQAEFENTGKNNNAMTGGRKMIRYQLYKENETSEEHDISTPKKSLTRADQIKNNKKVITKKAISKNSKSSRKRPRISIADKKVIKNNLKKIKKTNSHTSDGEEIVHWVQCEACYKWRKIPKGLSKQAVKKKFLCSFSKGHTCETTEESWRRHYTTISVE